MAISHPTLLHAHCFIPFVQHSQHMQRPCHGGCVGQQSSHGDGETQRGFPTLAPRSDKAYEKTSTRNETSLSQM